MTPRKDESNIIMSGIGNTFNTFNIFGTFAIHYYYWSKRLTHGKIIGEFHIFLIMSWLTCSVTVGSMKSQHSSKEAFMAFYWTLHIYKHKLGHPEGLTRSPSFSFSSISSFGVTNGKNCDSPASWWAACHQVRMSGVEKFTLQQFQRFCNIQITWQFAPWTLKLFCYLVLHRFIMHAIYKRTTSR